MKMNFWKSTCLWLALLVVAACGTEQDYRTYIPSQAKAILEIDLRSLAEKGGLMEPVAQQELKKYLQASLDEADFRFVEEFVENPLETGIACNHPCYLFRTAQGESALLAKVESRGDLKDLLEGIGENYTGWTVDEEDGFDYVDTDEYSIVFNSEAVLVLFNTQDKTKDNIRLKAMSWLRLKASDSFITNKDFKVLEQEGGDITGWVSLDVVSDSYKEAVQLGMPRDVNLDDLHYMTALSFDAGKVTMRARMLPGTDAAEKLYEQQSAMLRPIQGDFLPDVSTRPWIWMGLSADGETFYQQLISNANLSQLLEGVTFGFDIQKLISSVQGDFSIWAPSANQADVVVRAHLKDDSILDDMDQLAQFMALLGVDIRKDGANGYCLKGSNDSLVWMGVDEMQNFYYSFSKECLKPARQRPAWAKEAIGNLFYLRVDVAKAVEAVAELPMCAVKPSVCPVLDSFVNELVVEAKNAKLLEAELRMADKETNSLKQFVDLLQQVYGTN